MDYNIPMFWPYVPREVDIHLRFTLLSRWIGQGPKCDLFEDRFAFHFNTEFCIATNSGTSALDLLYNEYFDINKKCVITPVLTCTATNMPLLNRGFKLLFADIDIDTMNISIDSVEELIQQYGAENIAGIVGVHLGGIPCDVLKLTEIANKNEIPLIFDAAQALTAKAHGKHISRYGHGTMFSFQAIKHITTGDGGMVVTKEREHADAIKRKRWFGIDRHKKIAHDWKPFESRQMTFDVNETGYKYHMNDIAATMGIEGLNHVDDVHAHRAFIHSLYSEELSKVDGITLLKWTNDNVNSSWLFTCYVKNREGFCTKLKEAGVETNIVQIRNDIYEVFGGQRQPHLFNMTEVEDKYISLPLHMNVTEADARMICDIIKGGW